MRFADLASSCPTPYTRPDITSLVLNLLFSQLLHSFLLAFTFLLCLSPVLVGGIFLGIAFNIVILILIGWRRYYFRRLQTPLCRATRLGEFYTKWLQACKYSWLMRFMESKHLFLPKYVELLIFVVILTLEICSLTICFMELFNYNIVHFLVNIKMKVYLFYRDK